MSNTITRTTPGGTMARGVNLYFDTWEEAERHCPPETHYVEWLYTAYAVLPFTPWPAHHGPTDRDDCHGMGYGG